MYHFRLLLFRNAKILKIEKSPITLIFNAIRDFLRYWFFIAI